MEAFKSLVFGERGRHRAGVYGALLAELSMEVCLSSTSSPNQAPALPLCELGCTGWGVEWSGCFRALLVVCLERVLAGKAGRSGRLAVMGSRLEGRLLLAYSLGGEQPNKTGTH